MLADKLQRDGLARMFSSTFVDLAETTFTDAFQYYIIVVAAGRERRRLFGGARQGLLRARRGCASFGAGRGSAERLPTVVRRAAQWCCAFARRRGR